MTADTAFGMERLGTLPELEADRPAAAGPAAAGPAAVTGPSPRWPAAGPPSPDLLGEPVWVGGEAVPILAWVHVPARATGGCCVLCPPLFAEHKSSHAAYRDLARRLAGAGVVAVRFDYPGSGDSGALPAGADPVTCWLDAVDHAVDLARKRAVGPVSLVGMRVGAVVAALAAQRRGDVDAMVLWDPCDSGRAFLRRQQSLHLLQHGPGEDGLVEVPGAALDQPLARAIGALRMPRVPVAKRALVLVRPDGEAPVRSDDTAGPASEVDVVSLPLGEQEALLETDPIFRRSPEEGIERIVRWLPQVLVGPAAHSGGAPGAAHAASPLSSPGAVEAIVPCPQSDTGVPVVERVRWLGPSRLFAVESVAAGRRVPPRRPVVVLLPQGNDRHTGSGDLWVSLARRWASAGFRCVRVDLSGLGESPARPGSEEQVIRLPEAFDDVADVVRAVAEDPRDVVLVGLCSSGYQALEGAVAHDLGGVLAVNPVLRFVPPEMFDGGPMSPRRKICVNRPLWMTALRKRLPDVVGRLAAKLRTRLEGRRDAERRLGWQQDAARRGVQVYCLCGPVEAEPLMGAFGAELQTPSSGGRFHVDVAADLDHALLRARDRAVVEERLTAQLERLAAGR